MIKNVLFCFLFVSQINAQFGCTDPLANNYNSSATINNGSCTYNSSFVNINNSYAMSSNVQETSRLIEWNNFLYTHNDNSDTNLYKIDKTNGSTLQTIAINNTINIDWEEIAQDQNYIYLGDFGNNVSGNRTDLKIYKILKSSINNNPVIETINFSYSDQTDFSPQTTNNTNFDCEAFVVTNNNIILFTKRWVDNKTSIYSLTKNSGTQVASFLTTLEVSGLITGSTLIENYKLIALCGYSQTLNPFIYLIYDFQGTNFQNANKRKINISTLPKQISGISTTDGLEYYLSGEKFYINQLVQGNQQLHKLSLSNFTSSYINNLAIPNHNKNTFSVFPNPTKSELNINYRNSNELNNFIICDIFGRIIEKSKIYDNKINVENLISGVYFIEFTELNEKIKFIKN